MAQPPRPVVRSPVQEVANTSAAFTHAVREREVPSTSTGEETSAIDESASLVRAPISKPSIPTTEEDSVAIHLDDDFEDGFGDAAFEATKTLSASASESNPLATQSTTHLDSDDEDLFREIDSFL